MAKTTKKNTKQEFYENIVAEVKQDFEARQLRRRPYELQWQLNMNFLMGNQYCGISPQGAIEQEDKYYFWQEKQVYNHIAPIVETRVARLNHVRPKMSVRPFSNSESDISAAKTSTKILNSASDRFNLSDVIMKATLWSEVTGTSFYKVVWNNDKGITLASNDLSKRVGDVEITVCSPFEIYPDSNVSGDVSECDSIIHAVTMTPAQVKQIWNADVVGSEMKVFALGNAHASVGGYGYNSTIPSITAEKVANQTLVLERYTKPTADLPNGELVITAGDTLLYYGELPYLNGVEGQRDFPFVRQVAHRQVGCFWGASVIDRIIPLQRSYNAVKNRKHEFLNRLAMGVMTVEDGSVDTDNLESEGLSPGKVLVYRQGSNKPTMLDSGHVPMDFTYEEDRLLNEFVVVSGVSELARNSSAPTSITSGVALQLLVEQDDARLSATAEEIRNAVMKIGKHILRLYKQLATTSRLCKVMADNQKVESFYFSASDVSSDDIVFDTTNELNDSLASRRNMALELLRAGVLLDGNGKLSENSKNKILEIMGFGNWEGARSLAQMHADKAQRENLEINSDTKPLTVDDHEIHIAEHTAYVISGKNKGKTQLLLDHIEAHRQLASATQQNTLQEILKGGANE